MKKYIRVLINPKNDSSKYLVIFEKRDCNCWNFPGGKVEKNETIKDACIREISEEISIRISELQFLTKKYIKANNTIWEGFYYYAKKYDGDVVLLEDKGLKYKYIDKKAIKENDNIFISAVASFL